MNIHDKVKQNLQEISDTIETAQKAMKEHAAEVKRLEQRIKNQAERIRTDQAVIDARAARDQLRKCVTDLVDECSEKARRIEDLRAEVKRMEQTVFEWAEKGSVEKDSEIAQLIADKERLTKLAAAERSITGKSKRTFAEHLEWASRVVSSWPEWKQNLLDGPAPKPPENEPI